MEARRIKLKITRRTVSNLLRRILHRNKARRDYHIEEAVKVSNLEMNMIIISRLIMICKSMQMLIIII